MEVVRQEEKYLKDIAVSLPDSPGVYIFKGASGEILYIGKAKSLKKRVQSYFSRDLSSKTQAMVSKVRDIEYRASASAAQAQLLEAALIKEKQPPYNTSLKDDKSFPLIRITQEEFPLVSICRRKTGQRKDNALYFGPYTDARLLRQAFKVMRRIFGFRSCRKMSKDVCLYYRLALCPAPCIGKVTARKYEEIIKEIVMFLESRYEELISRFSVKMREASARHDFEEAGRLRDQINAMSVIGQNRLESAALDELEDLKEVLGLGRLPQKIEAFDISNISGKEACGSMVNFCRGIPDKNNYRRFRIKTVDKIDDYKMLAEIIRRRYVRLREEKLPLPDLVLIDGGKSHLAVAQKELKKLGLDIPLMSIAKERENIYTKNKTSPLRLTARPKALNLIRRVRDEAHRFALAYHHILMKKKILGR